MHLTPAAHRLFADQHGVASVQQLTARGLTRRQLRQLVEAHAIDPVLRGAYRSPSAVFNEAARCVAVSVARHDAVVSGPTAGRLWGFRRLPRDRRIHVITPPASNPAIATWVVPYRTAAIHRSDVIERPDGIRLTSRARTAFDLARWLTSDDLLSVIEQAIRDGDLEESDLWAVATDWISPRRPWARRFLYQLMRRVGGGAAESHPEVRVATALVDAGVRGLVRQFPIDLPGYGRARFDLAIPALQWAIEIDVYPTHEESAGRAADVRRDRAASQVGWDTTRIARTDYDTRFEETIDVLAQEARRRRHQR